MPPSVLCQANLAVLYLPLSEDCLDGRGEGPPLDLLNEYRVAGLTWRIGGKRPTLFAFLRQADVVLPEADLGRYDVAVGWAR